MTPDALQERVARMMLLRRCGCADPESIDTAEMRAAWVECQADAAAVLADLREAGELRTLEQVGFLAVDKGMFVTATGPLRSTDPSEGWVPVYIVREADSEPPAGGEGKP